MGAWGLYEVRLSALPVALIELDDRTHQRRDRRDRDLFLNEALAAAGVPILRVPAAASYDLPRLREQLRGVLNASTPG